MDSSATTTAGSPISVASTLAGAKRCREEGPQEVPANAGSSLPQGQQPTTSPGEAGGHEADLVTGSAKRPHHASLTTAVAPSLTGEAPPPSPSSSVPPASANTEPATRAAAATTAAGAGADAAELVPVGVTSIPPATLSAAVVVPAGAAVAHPPPASQPSSPAPSPSLSQPAAAATVSKSPSPGVDGTGVATPAVEGAGAGAHGIGAGDAGAADGADGTPVPAKAEVEKCQVCHQQERRYCCPRCGKLTCSLPCCVRHKKEEGCNGQRDKVAFVGLKDFTDGHLRSDFNFLEDALRCVDGGRRALARRPGVLGNPRQQRNSSGAPPSCRGLSRKQPSEAYGSCLCRTAWPDVTETQRRSPAPPGAGVDSQAEAGAPVVEEEGEGGGRGGGGRGSGRGVGGGGDGGSGDAKGGKGAAPAAGAAEPQALKGAGASQTEAMAPPDPRASGAAASARESASGESASKAPETPPVPSVASSTCSGGNGALSSNMSSATAPTSQDLLEIERRLSAAGGGGGSKSSSGGEGEAGVGVSIVAPPKTRVLWKVEWVFCSATAAVGRGSSSSSGSAAAASTAGKEKSGDVTVSDPSVSEELSLFEALSKHLEPRPGNAPLRHRLKRFSKPWTHDSASSGFRPADGATATASVEKCGGIGAGSGARAASFSTFSTAPPAADVIAGAGARRQQQGRQQRQLRLFLQRVPCAAKAPLYWELDSGERLGDALKGKTVIEYPTVYVTVRDDKGDSTARRFRTLVSDIDDDAPVAAAATASPGPGCDPAAIILGEVEKALAPPPPPPPSLEVDEQQLLSGVGETTVPGIASMDVASEEEEEADESDSESDSDSSSSGSSDGSSDSSSDSSDDEEVDKGIPPRPSFL